MRIVLSEVIGASGRKEAELVVHTDVAPWNQLNNALTGNVPLDMIQVIKGFHLGTIPIAGTGWDQPANHPLYPGKTVLQVLRGEIVRLNDAAARAVLGV